MIHMDNPMDDGNPAGDETPVAPAGHPVKTDGMFESSSDPRRRRTCRPAFILLLVLLAATAGMAADSGSDARQFISWLLQEDRNLTGIPFPEIVRAVSGKTVIPTDPAREADRELLAKIGHALDEVIAQMNLPESRVHNERRINEVSSHFENAMKEALNRVPGFSCDFPRLKSGKTQRSGYPDLRLEDKTTGRIVYLDPKLYEQGGRTSSFRTFYFEPKTGTNKILDDAHHLLVGFEHAGKTDGKWRFNHWEMVDLSKFRVRLKAEFQGSNRDIYRPESVVGTSRK